MVRSDDELQWVLHSSFQLLKRFWKVAMLKALLLTLRTTLGCYYLLAPSSLICKHCLLSHLYPELSQSLSISLLEIWGYVRKFGMTISTKAALVPSAKHFTVIAFWKRSIQSFIPSLSGFISLWLLKMIKNVFFIGLNMNKNLI